MSEDSLSLLHNAVFLEDLYLQYCQNPQSLSPEWKDFFQRFSFESKEESPQNSLQKKSDATSSSRDSLAPFSPSSTTPSPSFKIHRLVDAYRHWGHRLAILDPLRLAKVPECPELTPEFHGLSPGAGKEILDNLKKIYCGSVGVEFFHLSCPFQKKWIQDRMEKGPPRRSPEEKMSLMTHLMRAERFERWLQKKHPTVKRFGLEGSETLIPVLEKILEKSGHFRVNHVMMGMAHRGRLNVMANVLHHPLETIFQWFQESKSLPPYGSGDVKYHRGASQVRTVGAPFSSLSHEIRVSLLPNPSHLEFIHPVVLGAVWVHQRSQPPSLLPSVDTAVIPLLIHGDAAFPGQGIVAETLQLSQLPGYGVGGALHVILNNQIGFTTSPEASRTSYYASDPAKAIEAPIFHVNGDDPEAALWVAEMALDFRFYFHKDVVIDLIGYRRQGHNEIDDPSLTQPRMSQKIASHPSVVSLYEASLTQHPENRGSMISFIEDLKRTVDQELDDHLNRLNHQEDSPLGNTFSSPFSATGIFQDLSPQNDSPSEKEKETGVDYPLLQEMGNFLVTVPSEITPHPRLKRLLDEKKAAIRTGTPMDWAFAECLAFASLLREGISVRLSGQDVSRGTFSHRHSVWVDQKTEKKYTPLSCLPSSRASFHVIDSPLSEAGVLGFEYGASLVAQRALILWEAQFGDFSNGAQVIIDQFIVSGFSKWGQSSRLVLLLPHGYEGQGPEHSSARIERYLQLAANGQLQVIIPSTAANYFHALRRQAYRTPPCPLVMMTPKSLLRTAVSSLEEMAIGSRFMPVYGDPHGSSGHVHRLILCSGKVYYDLVKEREQKQLSSVAIFRLEQLYPFPQETLASLVAPLSLSSVVWCQEEPQNMGAWNFLQSPLISLFSAKGVPVHYVGRKAAASPAVGSSLIHQEEQRLLVHQALGIEYVEIL